MMLCPEAFSSASAHKVIVCWLREMGEVYEWMLSVVDDCTVVAATDARSSKIRFKLQTIVFDHQKDELEQLDKHIVYSGLPSNTDIRFPSRRVYGGLSNVEAVVGVLPCRGCA